MRQTFVTSLAIVVFLIVGQVLTACGGASSNAPVSTTQPAATSPENGISSNAPELATNAPEPTKVTAALGTVATLTEEPTITPTLPPTAASVAEEEFVRWAAENGEPYRTVTIAEISNDDFFAVVRVLAWFRPNISSPWEEREAHIECRNVGGVWQCDREFQFAFSEAEIDRRDVTATAVAISAATAEAASPVARVGETVITAEQFWKRVKLDQSQLQNDLLRYQQLEEQFGGQGFFTSQISQVQVTLSSPLLLAQYTLDEMLVEMVVVREASDRGAVVTDAEVDQALRDQIANGFGLVTEPQATATAQVAFDATATAVASTPTPPVDAAPANTPSMATPVPPTPSIITVAAYTEALTMLQQSINDVAGMSLDEYKEIIRANLLREKLQELIGDEAVVKTEEAVHARHILLRILDPEPTPTPVRIQLPQIQPSTTTIPTETPTATPSRRDEAGTLALATELRQRLLNGEDFAVLAAEYSDDPGSASNGGDLGWFGRGRMIAPFEDVAFGLAVGEVSDPVVTDYGYHLIQVLEYDSARPKDRVTLDMERAEAYKRWLNEQLKSPDVVRPNNLLDLLPPELR